MVSLLILIGDGVAQLAYISFLGFIAFLDFIGLWHVIDCVCILIYVACVRVQIRMHGPGVAGLILELCWPHLLVQKSM